MKSELYLKLYLFQMVMDDFPTSTINFFKLIYPLLEASPPLNCSQMAELSYMSPQAAKKHIRKLTNKGYLVRLHYRGWVMSTTIIKDPFIRTIEKAVLATG